jgi:hypothetical protein
MKKESSSDSKMDDALDCEICSLLAVEPSAEYVARVRRRIASEPAPSTWRSSWLLLPMAATVAVLLVIAQRPHEEIRSDGPQLATSPPAPTVSDPYPYEGSGNCYRPHCAFGADHH